MLKTSPFAWTSQFFFSYFFVYGIYLPFWALWLSGQGMTSSQIGILLGVAFATRCLANLVLTPRVHQAKHYLPALRVCTFLCILFGAVHGFLSGNFVLLIGATVLFNSFFAPIIPLSDAVANYYAKVIQMDYGKTRLWGSLAFILSSLSIGWVTNQWGINWVLYSLCICLFINLLLSLRHPTTAPQSVNAETQKRPKLLHLLRDPAILKFLFLISLLQGSHAAYYGFSAVHWKAAGHSETIIGYLWALGVVIEVGVFAFSRHFVTRLSLNMLFFISAMGCVIRWSGTALTTELWALVLLQLLHGITFALSHLAAIRYIQQCTSDKMVALQALYNAIALGAVIALLSAVCGWAYEHWHGQVFWGMAAMGTIALFFTRVELPRRTPTSQEGCVVTVSES